MKRVVLTSLLSLAMMQASAMSITVYNFMDKKVDGQYSSSISNIHVTQRVLFTAPRAFISKLGEVIPSVTKLGSDNKMTATNVDYLIEADGVTNCDLPMGEKEVWCMDARVVIANDSNGNRAVSIYHRE